MLNMPEVGIRPCLLPQSWDEVLMLGVGVTLTLVNLLIHLHRGQLISDWKKKRRDRAASDRDNRKTRN